jgi:hypothetical protein
MRFRASIALLLFVSACATSAPSPEEPVDRDPRLANLQRAVALPWTDGGQCAVHEASQPWPILAERCYQALDQDRIEFHDATGRCAVASAGAAAMHGARGLRLGCTGDRRGGGGGDGLVERGLAMACGFDFRIGVISSTHKDELERAFPELEGLVVVMDWC